MVMALLRYFQPVGKLPDPRGPLSTVISSEVILEMNRAVEEETGGERSTLKKRGPYQKFSASERSQIGKYAIQHGATAASKYFSRKLKKPVTRSTAKSIKNDYEEEIRKRRRAGTSMGIVELPTKKRGRKLLLGEKLDTQVQLYLKKVRDRGGVVSSRIAMAAARGILRKCNRSMLAENGGPILLTRYWALSLLKRMNYVQRKSTTSLSKVTATDFMECKKNFLIEVVTIIEMEDIPGELVLNWDQTGIKLVPSSTWTMEKRGERRVEMVGVSDKRQITAIFCGSAVGDFLPVQLIYKGKTSRCHPRYKFPTNWNVTQSRNHWSNEDTMIEYVSSIIIPYVSSVRERLNTNSAALVIMDNFKGQATPKIIQYLEENNILVSWLPPNTTDRLQPMDLSINKPAKMFLKNKFDEWYSEMVTQQLEGKDLDELEDLDISPIDLGMPVLKEISAQWFVDMFHYISDNPQFVVKGFLNAGITSAIDGVIDLGSGIEETRETSTVTSDSNDSDTTSDSECEDTDN